MKIDKFQNGVHDDVKEKVYTPEISAAILKQAKDAVGDSYEKIEQWLKNKGYLK